MTFETLKMSWANMFALFKASPPYTAIHDAFHDHWTLTDHLVATILDRTNVLLWTKTKDAHKKPPRNMPKRIPRPGVDARPKQAHVAGTVVPIEEFLRRQKESGRVQMGTLMREDAS